jgi:hypothetical protein
VDALQLRTIAWFCLDSTPTVRSVAMTTELHRLLPCGLTMQSICNKIRTGILEMAHAQKRTGSPPSRWARLIHCLTSVTADRIHRVSMATRDAPQATDSRCWGTKQVIPVPRTHGRIQTPGRVMNPYKNISASVTISN